MPGEVSCKTKSVGPEWGPAATAYGKGGLQGESPEEWSVIGSVGATGEFLLGRAGVITMADFFCIGVGLAVMHLRHKQPIGWLLPPLLLGAVLSWPTASGIGGGVV